MRTELRNIGRSRYRDGGDFNANSSIVSVPASGGNTPGRQILVSREIPGGAIAYIEIFSANVIDIANADQIYFQIVRNGAPLQAGSERIPGVQFQYQPQIALGVFVPSGQIEIWALNISGMNTAIEPTAIAGVAIQCQAWWAGKLLSEKGGII